MAVETSSRVNGHIDEQRGHAGHVGPRQYVSLGEVAQLYSDLSMESNQKPTSPPALLDQQDRARFEEKLRLFEKNAVEALRGSPSERPSWLGHLANTVFRRPRHDPIIKEYFFCASLPAGVVLLCEPSSRLYITFPPDARAPTWIADLLVRAEGLYIEIREILRHRNRGICLELVFASIVQLMRLMGNEDYRQRHLNPAPALPAGPNATPDKSDPEQWHAAPWLDLQKTYEAQFTQGADLVRRMAQRQAQLDYFAGMIVGAFVLAVVVLGVHLVPGWFGVGNGWMAAQLAMGSSVSSLLWLTPIIGGIGAVVSVMQRMGSGSFALRDRAGAGAIRRVGAFRPLIGAVFASVVVTMLYTGIVTIHVSSGEQTANPILLYCVVAFFSGFSERWARDMLGVGEAAVSGGTDAERKAAAT